MAEKERAMTGANIRYLLTLLELQGKDGGVRCVDLAARLQVSKPSVHAMVSSLCQLGLAEKKHYGQSHGGGVRQVLSAPVSAHVRHPGHGRAGVLQRGVHRPLPAPRSSDPIETGIKNSPGACGTGAVLLL